MFSSLRENPNFSPALILRLGLGLTLLYAGLNALLDPTAWVGFVPHWIGSFMSPNFFLAIHSVFELLLAVFLVVGIFLPTTSLVVFLDLTAILIFYGLDDLTFRDFGLAFAALALFMLSIKKE